MSKRSLTRAVVFLGVPALLASGCGRGSGTSAPAAAPPKATVNAMNPQPRDQVQDGGTFTWPLDEIPPNFNYNELDGTDQNNNWVISALMPEAFSSAADGTPIWDPNYLASEPTLVTDPTQIVTYEINPKAVWSDGTPITWQDFYWQWKATNGTDKRYQISSSNGYREIESVVRGKDDREVVVTYRHKFSAWQGSFNPLYPASTNKDPNVFNAGWKGHMGPTAGPFTFKSLDPTSQTITLVRNGQWWGNPAKLDSIVYRVISPDAQIDALANGEIDAMDIGPDANKFARAKTIAGTEIREAGGPNFRHLTINGTSQNLQDVHVRQALAMAIDRRAIAQALLGPLGIEPVPLNNHIFMANQRGYQDNSGDVGKYNPEKARQLLDAAGWKLDGSVRKKNGKPLQIACIIPTGVATSKQESELIQNMLGQVGVAMTITAVPSNDFFNKYIIPGQFDFTVFSWFGTTFPTTSARSIYAKPVRDSKGQLEIQQNFARIGSDQIDRLFDEAAQELDPQKANALANQADVLIWQEVHSLTLYQRPELWVCKKGLANFGAVGFASYVYQDIGWAKP